MGRANSADRDANPDRWILGGGAWTRVQHNPKSHSCQDASRRSNGYVLKTTGKYPGRSLACPDDGLNKLKGLLPRPRKSAEGIVCKGNEPRYKRGWTHPAEGPNGERNRMVRKMITDK